MTTINAGISGNTTVDALARIERDVLSHQPTLVTVMFGLNDMTRVPLETYRKNLKTIIAKCRGVGAKVLLCTPNNVIDSASRPISKLEQYCDVVREVGQELDVKVCDCYRQLESQRANNALGWRIVDERRNSPKHGWPQSDRENDHRSNHWRTYFVSFCARPLGSSE